MHLFCKDYPSCRSHKEDCLLLKSFCYDFGTRADILDLPYIYSPQTVDDVISRTPISKTFNMPHIPTTMKEYLYNYSKSIKSKSLKMRASGLLSIPLTILNALVKLNHQIDSKTLLIHVSDNSITFGYLKHWEVLLHLLPNVTVLHVVLFAQDEYRDPIEVFLCAHCKSRNKILKIDAKKISYIDYLKDAHYQQPTVVAFFNVQDPDDNVNIQELLKTCSLITCPQIITTLTESKAIVVSATLRSILGDSSIS